MTKKNTLTRFFALAREKDTLVRGVKIAITIGTIYNLINQGDVLVSGHLENLNYIKLTLTYMTPFFVSTYSSTMARMQLEG